MSAKSDVLDYQKKKDKAQSEAARSESRRGQFEGTTWVPATKLKERSDAHALERKSNLANRNALSLQKAKDAGSLAVAGRRQTGQTTRTGMTESGLGTRQTATLGQGQNQFDRTQGLKEFKSFQRTDPITGEMVRDPGAARDFNAYMGKGISIPQERLDAITGGSRPQGGNVRTITRVDGTKESYDARGNIIQPEQAPPPVFTFKAPGDRKVSTYVEQAPTQKSRSASEFERMGRVLNSPESMFVDTFFPKKKRAPKKTSVYGVKTNRML